MCEINANKTRAGKHAITVAVFLAVFEGATIKDTPKIKISQNPDPKEKEEEGKRSETIAARHTAIHAKYGDDSRRGWIIKNMGAAIKIDPYKMVISGKLFARMA